MAAEHEHEHPQCAAEPPAEPRKPAGSDPCLQACLTSPSASCGSVSVLDVQAAARAAAERARCAAEPPATLRKPAPPGQAV